jgi:glutamate synthase domain-containing protein 2
MTVRQGFFIVSILSIILVIGLSQFNPYILISFVILLPIITLGFYDAFQKKRTISRLYPVLAHFRYFMESIRPEIQQYFIETNLSGRPISREFRDLVYQRAKGERDTRPFGTQFDLYSTGYQWVLQSLHPKPKQDNPRIEFGGKDCTQPYLMSPLNISAMSFGSLSQNAIEALNTGAALGGFAHNTGEGGISPYHEKPGGDLIWQIGTGYFGCRDSEGRFDSELFKQQAVKEQVKMIEIKLSQGAKPGHGGILPAAKVTKEIARIRLVDLGKDVLSPPTHSAFATPVEMMAFITRLRVLSAGKPIGIKLCIGKKSDFLALCKAMIATDTYPDFITVDGGEGGTGAAPVELTNSVGMPLRDALSFVHNALIGFGIRQQTKLIASGLSISAFHLFRLLALGADTVNSARAMMLALGCIQSRSCNTDKCPTGIATQDPKRFKSLNVALKGKRVANYHEAMIHNLVELVSIAGVDNIESISSTLISKRVNATTISTMDKLYENLEPNCLLSSDTTPNHWRSDLESANPNVF